jgi:hypothetical protein
MRSNQRRCFHKNVPLPWGKLCSISILLLMAVPPAAASASAAALPANKATEAPALLPRDELFDWLIADPREAIFSVRYHGYKVEGEEFDAAAVSLGEYFGLVGGRTSLGVWQLGLEAAAFSIFNLESRSDNLINTDYRLGIPVTLRSDDWSYRVRLFHQSSHLGDEFLLQNEDVQRENISFEVIEALAAYHRHGLRPYAGAGYILNSDQPRGPWMLQYGVDYRQADFLGPFGLLAGVNVTRADAQDWEPSRSYRLGLDYGLNGHSITLLLEHFDGFAPAGQFFEMPVEYSGIGLYFRL